MIKISAVIITLNEEKNLERCLVSLAGIADEVVIVDSFSDDSTAMIAQQYNARIVQQAFLGYGAQKNFANRQAANDWILSLDADEALSNELKQSILHVKNNPTCSAYHLKRLTKYCGSWIRHCGWYPDKKIRLFDRTRAKWENEQIHEYIALNIETDEVGELYGDLLHYSYYTISDHLKQVEKFTEIMAAEAAHNGKIPSILKIWLVPKWNFFNQYVIRLGFLDGYAGYLVCKISAFASMVKYAKTRQYALLKKKES